MPSIRDLLNNLPGFNYYNGGPGNFTAKSLKYGDDRPGGGWSGQPYIVRSMGQTWSPSNFDDGTIRLGAAGAVERSTADVQRITKFFLDFPKGQQFLAKQVFLQMANPKLEQAANPPDLPSGGNLFSQIAALPSRINAALGTTRIFNPLGTNMLAQVGGVEFGTHFYRHGLLPVMDEKDKYAFIADYNNQDPTNSTVNRDAANRLIRTEYNLFDSNNTVVDQYSGGAGSIYGVGSTTINRVVDTIGNNAPNNATPDPNNITAFVPLRVQDLAKIGRDGILVVNTPNGTGQSVSFDTRAQDFRAIKNQLYNVHLPSSDYPTFNIENRIGRGNPGAPGLDRSKYYVPLVGTQDKINQLSLFYSAVAPGNGTQIIDVNSGLPVGAADVRDIVKFRIEAIDSDNPASSIWMVFRAFIDGLKDSWVSEWNEFKYTGRGENFYVYSGFKRQLPIAFLIVAQSRQEMKPLYQKLNMLMSCMAPDYNGANKMRGPMVKLTIGDYMFRQPGIITSLDIDVDREYPWEIALDEPESGQDQSMHEVPMILKVTLNFIPIHDFLPRKGASVPFISVQGRKSPDDHSDKPLPNDWLTTNNGVRLSHALNELRPKPATNTNGTGFTDVIKAQ